MGQAQKEEGIKHLVKMIDPSSEKKSDLFGEGKCKRLAIITCHKDLQVREGP